jgi:hypothetical protein
VVNLLPGDYTATAPLNYGGYQLTSPPERATSLTIAFTEDLTLDFGYAAPTGVLMQEFTAAASPRAITLRWHVLDDTDAFRVWRALDERGAGRQLLAEDVRGSDGGFEYVDRSVQPGVAYWYWLEHEGDGRVGPANARASGARLLLPLLVR